MGCSCTVFLCAQEMQDLDRKLMFLERRFDDAEKTKWMGMLKKNPLW